MSVSAAARGAALLAAGLAAALGGWRWWPSLPFASVSLPVRIGARDGVVAVTVVQHPPRRRPPGLPQSMLRLGVDTGSSLTWALDRRCAVLTKTYDKHLRRTLVAVNTTTRHRTLLDDDDDPYHEDARKPLSVRFGDGTKISGTFRPASFRLESSTASSSSPSSPSPSMPLNIFAGAATSVTERVKHADIQSQFENGTVDGYLGLGLRNERYPVGHSAWENLLRMRHQEDESSDVDAPPRLLRAAIDLRLLPALRYLALSAGHPDAHSTLPRAKSNGASIPISGTALHWSCTVHNVRLSVSSTSGTSESVVVFPRAVVVFDTGAASVFVPSDTLKIRADTSERLQLTVQEIRAQHKEARPSLAFDVVHDTTARDSPWHRTPVYRLARRLFIGSNHDTGLSNRTVRLNGLAVNRSLHSVLTNRPGNKDNRKKRRDEGAEYGVDDAASLPQIILGLPFFLRHKVVFSEELIVGNEAAPPSRKRFVHIN